MNSMNAIRLAWVFCVSSARAKKTKRVASTRITGRPVTNMYASFALFVLSSGISYFVLGRSLKTFPLDVLASQITVFLPAFTMSMSMVYSLLTELNQPANTASTDMMNWLPIEAGDFVLGSALTTIYFVSPVVSILLGASFGLFTLAGSLDVWALGAALGIFGCLLGAMVLEIVRGAMNRTSRAFSRMRGQKAVVLRMLLNVSLILTVSMMFNLSIMIRLAAWFSISLKSICFVPLLWPSMIVLEHASGNLRGALIYFVLSFLLLMAFYYAGIRVRKMYWTPAPVALKLQSARGVKSGGILNHLWFDTVEVALIRKDLRSLLRRREMASMFALPLMMVLVALLGTKPTIIMDPSIPLEDKIPFLCQCAMGVLFLNYQLALRAVGQEREEFVNLLMAPIDVKSLLNAKIASAIIPTMPAYVLFLAVTSYVARIDMLILITLLLVGLTFLTAVSSVELAIGSRYAVFTSGGRTRFVKYEGYLIGLLLCMATLGATLLPIALHHFFGFTGPTIAFALSGTIALAISMAGIRVARKELARLFDCSW